MKNKCGNNKLKHEFKQQIIKSVPDLLEKYHIVQPAQNYRVVGLEYSKFSSFLPVPLNHNFAFAI